MSMTEREVRLVRLQVCAAEVEARREGRAFPWRRFALVAGDAPAEVIVTEWGPLREWGWIA